MFDLSRARVSGKFANSGLTSGLFKITASSKAYAKSRGDRMRVHVWTLHGGATGRPSRARTAPRL